MSERVYPSINEVGNVYGRLTVLSRVPGPGAMFLCQCECGNTKAVNGSIIRQGLVKSCGCLMKPWKSGDKYGHLTIVDRVTKVGATPVVWTCLCDCGSKITAVASNLALGKHKGHCGCLPHGKIIPDNGAFIRNKILSLKNRAKKYGREYNLTTGQVKLIVTLPCFYCGSHNEFTTRIKRKNGFVLFKSMGIDRVNNNAGYVSGNVVPCCHYCNTSKKNKDAKEWMISKGLLTK